MVQGSHKRPGIDIPKPPTLVEVKGASEGVDSETLYVSIASAMKQWEDDIRIAAETHVSEARRAVTRGHGGRRRVSFAEAAEHLSSASLLYSLKKAVAHMNSGNDTIGVLEADIPEGWQPSSDTPGDWSLGLVRWYSAERGFGFITPVDGGDEDVFMHYSALAGAELRNLHTKQYVRYLLEEDSSRRRASRVELLEIPDSAESSDHAGDTESVDTEATELGSLVYTEEAVDIEQRTLCENLASGPVSGVESDQSAGVSGVADSEGSLPVIDESRSEDGVNARSIPDIYPASFVYPAPSSNW